MQVVQFNTNTAGTVSPASTLTLPGNIIPTSIATDSTGQIYVPANLTSSTGEVLVYAAGASGAAAPVRMLTFTLSMGGGVSSIAVDSSGQIYLAAPALGEVFVFAANATGSVAPVRTVQWDATQFAGGQDLAFDASGYMYVLGYEKFSTGALTNPGAVWVFAPNATGVSAPVRTLIGTTAALISDEPSSLAVDAAGDIFTVIYPSTPTPTNQTLQLAEFAAGASGDAVPIKTIVGNYSETSAFPTHLRVDASGDLYAFGQFVSQTGLPQNPAVNPIPPSFVAVFPPSASGNVTPSIQFTSSLMQDGAIGFAAF